MEKIKNKITKNIEIVDDVFLNLNKNIEGICVNSRVLFVVDFYTYKNYKVQLEEVKTCSLNQINICVIDNFNLAKNEEKIERILNEAFHLIVGFGNFFTLKFIQGYAIKNNILYSFVCLNGLKSEIFCDFLLNISQKIAFYPPLFVKINKKMLSKNLKFYLYSNIYKYIYLFIENLFFDRQQENINNFLLSYQKILKDVNDENLIDKTIALGLLLNKYRITFFCENVNEINNDFQCLVKVQFLLVCYRNILQKINRNSLFISRPKIVNNQRLYSKINFEILTYERRFLLLKKREFIYQINSLLKCEYKMLEKLKDVSFKSFCDNVNRINPYKVLKSLKENSKDLFLQKSEYFEIFNIFREN